MADILEGRENGAVLAGLRLLQAWREDKVSTVDAQIDVGIDDVESGGGEFEVLSAEEIDGLCERINCGELRL